MAFASPETIRENDEIPVLRKMVDAETLVRYAGASDDYVYLHWNKPRVLEEGLPDIIVHGWLTFAYMCQSVSAWLPPDIAEITKSSVRYHRPTYPGEITCSGRVTKVEASGTSKFIDVELWACGADGEITTTGTMQLVVKTPAV